MKRPYLAIFELELEKTIVMLDFSTFNLWKCNISCKKKIKIKCRTKIDLLGFLGSNFEKPLSYLKSVPSNLPYCKVWSKKYKSWNLGPKIPDLNIFGEEFESIIFIYEISGLELALLQSLVQKVKILKFVAKNARFEYFGAGTSKY